MEILFLSLADFLTDIASSLRGAVENGDGFQQITILALGASGLGVVLAGLRQIVRWLMRVDSRDREEKREAQRECARVGGLLKEAEQRIDVLRAYDPEIFLKNVVTAKSEGVLSKRRSLPEEWLAPLRPALGRAYADLAREKLLSSYDEVGLAEAHRLAYAALAAEPDLKEFDEIFDGIEGARSVLRATDLSEEERDIWKAVSQMDDPVAMKDWGYKLFARGRYATAKVLMERAIEMLKQGGMPMEAALFEAQTKLGWVKNRLGNYSSALADFEELWGVLNAHRGFGPDHLVTLRVRYGMAEQLRNLGRTSEAIEIFEDVIRCFEQDDISGAVFLDTVHARTSLAIAYGRLGRHAEAFQMHQYEWQLLKYKEGFGPNDRNTLLRQFAMAQQRGFLGENDKALSIHQEVWAALCASKELGPDHPRTHVARVAIGDQLRRLKRYDEAISVLEEVLTALTASADIGPSHPHTFISAMYLAMARAYAGDPQRGLNDYLRIRDERKEGLGGNLSPDNLLFERVDLVELYDLAGQREIADQQLEGLRDKMLEKMEPTHHMIKQLDAYVAGRDA